MTGLELYAVYGLLNLFRVMFKASAQLIVVNGHYMWVLPNSFVLGVLETVTWGTPGMLAAQYGLFSGQMITIALVLGLSGGLGAILAMRMHKVESA